MDKKTYAGYIEENRQIFTDVSDQIWEYAELSVKEHRSAALYVRVLKELGFAVTAPFDNIETAFIGTYGSGIWLMDRDLNLIRRINTSNEGQGIKSNHITSFLEDSGHRIWITTEGGGISFTSRDWTTDKLGLRNLTKAEGLPSNVACAIAEDRDGKLWVSTTHGLAQLDPETERFSASYFEESHVTVNQYSYGAAYTAANGTVYMGSTDGLIAFSPALLKTRLTLSPSVRLIKPPTLDP